MHYSWIFCGGSSATSAAAAERPPREPNGEGPLRRHAHAGVTRSHDLPGRLARSLGPEVLFRRYIDDGCYVVIHRAIGYALRCEVHGAQGECGTSHRGGRRGDVPGGRGGARRSARAPPSTDAGTEAATHGLHEISSGRGKGMVTTGIDSRALEEPVPRRTRDPSLSNLIPHLEALREDPTGGDAQTQ
jgi:hypothetical protein